MKKMFLIVAVFFGFIGAKAQNPFAEYGYTPKIATLSQGQFNEFFDQDTIVQIGSVLFNTKSKQIVAFVETDTVYSEATLEPDIVSRWISPDPLADHPNQIGLSPYQYAWNNPIYWTDPDGQCPLCPWIDAIVDVGFVLYDVGEIIYDYSTTGEVDPVSVAALTADAASILVPMSVGAGLAVRGAAKAAKTINKVDNAVDVAKAANKASDVSKTANKGGDAMKQIGPAGDAGATVTKQVPADWKMKTSNNKQGTKFLDPNNPSGNNVRVQRGNPNSPNSGQQRDYVKQTKGGKTVDVSGKQVPSDSKAAHIPKEDFKFKKD